MFTLVPYYCTGTFQKNKLTGYSSLRNSKDPQCEIPLTRHNIRNTCSSQRRSALGGFFRHVIFAKWVISKETTSNYRTVYTPPPPLQNIYPLIQTGNFLSTESVNIDQQHSLLLVNNITTLIFLQHTIIILLNFPHLLSCGIPKLFLLSCVLRKWRK